ncbi:MAG: pectinesterase family protein [Nibricoccus sp.]
MKKSPLFQSLQLLGIALLATVSVHAQTTVFNDTFSGASTLNATSATAPTATSADYQLISSKTWSPTPSIAAGHLQFGIAATTAGTTEVQARFTNSAITLANAGEYIELTTTFTNTSGLVTQAGQVGFGLYNSGSVSPIAGGMNGNAVNTTLSITGGAQNWLGYVNRIAFTGGNNRLATRPAQTATTGNNQDLVTEGSGSQSYANPVTLNTATSALTLSAGNQYTQTLRITLTAASTLKIDSALYSGADTTTAALYTQTVSSVTSANFLTATFDALAVGWRMTANTSASAIDIQSIKVVTTAAVTIVPVISTQPLSQTKSVGDAVTLSVVANGGGATPLSYQWKKGGNNISGATSATYTIPSAVLGDAGDYTVAVTNSAGTTTSSIATLTISSGAVAPSIATDPVSATVLVGGANTFTTVVNGTAPLSYQWQKSTDNGANYTNISSATSSSYAIASATLTDAGLYRLVVTNAQGSATSAAATLTVNQAPVITAQPVSATLNPGAALNLSVTANGSPTPTYQWKLNGANIAGATASTYSVASVTGANTGNYTVVVTNSVGSTTSSIASVAVLSSSMAVTATTPVNAATSQLPDTRLTITFNQAVTPGVSGLLRIYDASNDTVVETIDLTDATTRRDTVRAASAANTLPPLLLPILTKPIGGIATNFNYYPITVSGNTATIYPRNSVLAYGKSYYVKIDAGVFVNASGESFAGIATNTAWTFTTKTSGPTSGATSLTVAADGSGDFCTLQAALDFIPANNTAAITISIKNGTYFEQVAFQSKNNLTFLGQDRDQTAIVYPNNNNLNNVSGVYHRSTVVAQSVSGVSFINLKFVNSTPQTGSQAEALIINGSAANASKNILTRCALYSYQDTLQINKQAYVSDCYIEGDVDFIWGDGPVYFENCEIKSLLRSGSNIPVVAQVRNGSAIHGFVFRNCRFTASAGVTGGVLNRIAPADFPYCEVVILDSTFGDATNNAFLNTTTANSNSDYKASWWLLNNASASTVATAAANIHNWTYNIVNKDGTGISDGNNDAFTNMPDDATLRDNYRNVSWVLNHKPSDNTMPGSWTPALTPLFLTHPAAASVSSGQPVTLSASTAAVPAATYQWKKDGNTIAGATSATYTIAAAAGSDAGTYTVVATNASGSTTSNAALVTVAGVAVAPSITTQPASQSVSAGASVSFTVAASGTAPLTYQWKKGGADISGATSATYTIAASVIGDSGSYTVVVTNAGGSATSNAATLTVSAVVGPIITTQPVSRTVAVGATTSFTVAATGTGTLTYQWQKEINGTFTNVPFVFDGNDSTIITDLSGIATPTLSFVHAQVINAGNYRVLVTDSAGTTTSNTVAFTVNTSPVGVLTFDGFAGSVTGGGSLTPVVVTTAAALKTAAESTSAAVITVSGVIDLGTSGRINVKSNKTIRGADTGATIIGTLSLSTVTNVIIANLNVTAYTGARASNDGLTVGSGSTNVLITKCTFFNCTDGNLDVTNGSDAVTISWCKFYYTRDTTHNFSNLIGSADDDVPTGGYRTTWHHNWWGPGCKQRMLACRFGGAHMFNNYWSCTGDDYCTESRNIAEMLSEYNYYDSVKDPLAKRTALATDQGKLKTIGNVFNNCTGSQLVSADAIFTPSYSYKVNAAADIPTLVMAGAGNVGTDAPAAGAATISGSTSVATGASTTLTATPSGFTPASYQWRFKNADISGATSATYTLIGAQSTNAGAYTVVLGLSGGGSVISSPLTLTVTAAPVAPTITTQPASLSATVGGSASFSVTATGTGLSYQWKKGGTDISGATSATYTIANVALTDAASYTVVVTNTGGSVTSSSATLLVAPAFAVAIPTGYGGSATGGGNLAQVIVATAADFRTQAESSSAAVITVSGTLNLGTTKVAVKSNKTIQGVDTFATVIGNLELASGVSNVIIRGINVTNPGTPGGDGITLTGATNVFITHVDFFDCSDTLLRIVSGADNITVSWCEFSYTAAQTAHRYATLIGATTGETKALRVTLDHNWYSDRVDQQQPSSTYGQVHVYNNYFNPNGTANTSGSVALANAQFLSERNQYTNIVSPLTKSGGGLVRTIGNVYTTTTGTAADAGTDAVFTPAYSYHLHATADVPAKLLTGAGNTAGAASPTPAAASASINATATAITTGGTFTLTALPSISAVTGYQWRLNNADIAGATALTYTVSNAQSANAGIYTVAIANVAGEAIVSSPTTITVTAAPTPPATPAASGGGGGGGAPSWWFFGALALIATLRRFKKSVY